MRPQRGFESLRRYRWSESGASYFLTLCTADRVPGLEAVTVATAIRREVDLCESDRHWQVRAGVIMPDHLHLFIELCGDLALGRIVARLKAKTKPALSSLHLRWQGNYYEHHLRPADPVKDVLSYIFLNPYRAGLLSASEVYPWFWITAADASWFRPTLDHDLPPPEWLK